MDDMEEAVLQAAQQIIDDERAVNTIMETFGVNHRLATKALEQIRRNVAVSARKHDMPVQEYIALLSEAKKLALFGFCTGVVTQKDYDAGLLPDGSARPRPEYEI